MTTTRTTEDGCVEIVVVKDGFTEIGWVSSSHLVHTKEQQLLRAIERKAAIVSTEISNLERDALGNGATESLPPFVVPPIHDA